MTTKTGQCMCGAVKYRAETPGGFSQCYCKMCQRWASGIFMGVHTTSFEVTEGADALTVFKSSDWAERGFCNICGSNIYYHATEHGTPSVAIGTLDDPNGLEIKNKWYVDLRPAAFNADANATAYTQAETLKMFGEV